MIQLIKDLIAALIAALNAPRENTEAIEKARDDALAALDAANEKLQAEDVEDAELDGLRPEIERAIALAAAARPPTQDQINTVTTALGIQPIASSGAVGAFVSDALDPVEKKAREEGAAAQAAAAAAPPANQPPKEPKPGADETGPGGPL